MPSQQNCKTDLSYLLHFKIIGSDNYGSSFITTFLCSFYYSFYAPFITPFDYSFFVLSRKWDQPEYNFKKHNFSNSKDIIKSNRAIQSLLLYTERIKIINLLLWHPFLDLQIIKTYRF